MFDWSLKWIPRKLKRSVVAEVAAFILFILPEVPVVNRLWMCFGVCLITHACCGFHQGLCIRWCLFSVRSEPQLDSHLEGPVCYAHKQDGSKLAAQKACGLEWCCPTPQLHYWAMLMMQPPLIYSLFNTIKQALVSDLARLTLQRALSSCISSLKKK